MAVFRPMSGKKNIEGMTNLLSKYVRDCRFRPSEDGKSWSWVRRSRLVAKEFSLDLYVQVLVFACTRVTSRMLT